MEPVHQALDQAGPRGWRVCLWLLLLCCASGRAAVVNLDWDTAVFPTGGNNINYAVGTANLNISHTGAMPGGRPVEAGTYSTSGGFGAGNSVIYGGNANTSVVTNLRLTPAVTNIQVSLYDIDNNDTVTVRAFNGATEITASLILAPQSATPTFTLTGNTATGNGTNSAGGSTNGTLNVTVPGPATRLRVSGISPSTTSFLFAVSDVTLTAADPPAAGCSVTLDRLDWDNQAYPAGQLNPSFMVTDVAPFPPVTFTFSHSGNTADLGAGSPGESAGFTNTGSVGGGGSMLNYFHDPNPDSDPQDVTINVAFSDTLRDVRFSIADIDSAVTANDFADQVTIVGTLPGGGTVSPVFEAVSAGATYGFAGGSVNAHLTFNDGTNDSPRSAVNVYFASAITGLRITYDDLGPQTWDSSRAMLLSDVLYCPPSSVPVTLSYFNSSVDGDRVKVRWQTSSQTLHAGFELQVMDASQRIIASETVATSQQWSTQVLDYAADLPVGHGLRLVSFDINGHAQSFGPFRPGMSHGRRQDPNPIDWRSIRKRLAPDLAIRGLRLDDDTSVLRRAAKGSTAASAWVEVSSPGIQRVTYAALAAAGVSLDGVAATDIAVSFRGEGVSRLVNIAQPALGFGPGDSIDFVGQVPSGDDALYLSAYRYRIGIDPAQAIAGRRLEAVGLGAAPAAYDETLVVENNRNYQPATPTDDPWFDVELSTLGLASTDVVINLAPPLASGTAQLRVDLVGLTDFQDGTAPDHHAQVFFNGAGPVIDARTDGLTPWLLSTALDTAALNESANTVRITLPGDTGYAFDIVNFDALSLTYPRGFVAIADQLVFTGVANRFELSGFSSADIGAWAVGDDGQLVALQTQVSSGENTFEVSIPGIGVAPQPLFASGFEAQPASKGAEAALPATYFVSTIDQLRRPAVSAASDPGPLVAADTDFLIVAHPAFIGPALDQYVAVRAGQGFRPQVISVLDIYERHGFGMALPAAIVALVDEALATASVEHLLLVGADSYDYRDYTGAGSLSFIPTRYAATDAFVNFTPSDGLLTDVDGDEVPDLAVGRWPVRTPADLTTLIDKTLVYEDSGLAAAQKVLLAAGTADVQIPEFSGQARRVADRLDDPGGQPWGPRTEVFLDDLDIDTARQMLIDGINAGQTVTVYSGHGAPDAWAFEGLLTPALAATLNNQSSPTLMLPLTCYTTYWVDPSSDTLAYELMIGGQYGAAAVQGAATLSTYGDNEALAVRVVDGMLDRGLTLGQAIAAAKQELAALGFERYRPVIINWALLGDPTLRVLP